MLIRGFLGSKNQDRLARMFTIMGRKKGIAYKGVILSSYESISTASRRCIVRIASKMKPWLRLRPTGDEGAPRFMHPFSAIQRPFNSLGLSSVIL